MNPSQVARRIAMRSGAPSAGGAAGSATIDWTAPATNSSGLSFDGSTNDRTLAGYRVYYDTISPPAAYSVSTGATSVTVSGLAAGTWYFAVTALDGDGDESDVSGIISKVVT